MFNLIISIIAIALVVALAAATLYYGGDAFNKGSNDAKASTFINQAQQLDAAVTLSKATGSGDFASMEALVASNFLSATPKPPVGEWAYDGTDFTISGLDFGAEGTAVVSDELCEAITEKSGGTLNCTNGTAAVAAIITSAQ